RFTLRGPYGTFQLREPVTHDVLGVAFNAGIAPLMSMVRNHFPRYADTPQRFAIIYAYSNDDLFLYGRLLEAMAREHERLSIFPLETHSEDPAEFPERLIANALAQCVDTPATWQAYVAGLGKFIEGVAPLIEAAGIEQSRMAGERYD
ncbi:MAG: hypothetical protein ABI743_03500, partial [bacterium]